MENTPTKTNTELVIQELNNNAQTLAKIALINMPEGTSMAKAEKVVMRELINMEMILQERYELANLDRNSIFLAVRNAIADNLTLSPNAKLVYLYPGKVCIGMNGNTKIYKDILQYEPTSEGRISIARQAGAIIDHERPEVTYDVNGKVIGVTFKFKSKTGTWKIVSFDTHDFERWKQKSAAKFGGTPNANYTSHKGGIDPEFARAKAIKHGLKKLGINANEVQKFNEAPIIDNVDNVEISHLTHRVEVIKETIQQPANEKNIHDVKFEEVKHDETQSQTQEPKEQTVKTELPNVTDLF